MTKRLRDFYDKDQGLNGYMVKDLIAQAQADGATVLSLTRDEYSLLVQVFDCPPDWDGRVWGIKIEIGKLTTEDRINALETFMLKQLRLNDTFEVIGRKK